MSFFIFSPIEPVLFVEETRPHSSMACPQQPQRPHPQTKKGERTGAKSVCFKFKTGTKPTTLEITAHFHYIRRTTTLY